MLIPFRFLNEIVKYTLAYTLVLHNNPVYVSSCSGGGLPGNAATYTEKTYYAVGILCRKCV